MENGLVIGANKIGRMRKKQALGFVSVISLVIILLGLLFPMVKTEASAEEIRATSAYLTPMLGLSLSDMSVLEVDPSSNNGIATASMDLVISSTGSAGYKVYLSGGGGGTNLTNVDATIDAKIEAIAGTMALSAFPDNTWGYSLAGNGSTDELLYTGVPEVMDAAVLEKVAGADTLDRYDLSFATKVDTALPAGAYSGGVVVSVVATPFEVHTLSDLTYMQDMSTYVCEASAENETKQLIDTRDGKSYWVAKLKDGNCWMTQNLALDLSTSRTLTPADTDVTANYTPTSSTNEMKFDGTAIGVDLSSQLSWNLGKVVLGTPLLGELCRNYGDTGANSSVFDDNLGEVCRGSGFVDVDSDEWKATFVAQAGEFDDVSQPLVAVDVDNKVYDAHYLIGNYYSWNAATAGNKMGTETQNENAPDSICPKGWRLPVSGKNSNNQPIVNPYESKGSFYQLLLAYGYPETSRYSVNASGVPYTSIRNAQVDFEDNIAAAPMYLVRSGSIHLELGYSNNLGLYGLYWSATVADDDGKAARLSFNKSIVYQSYYGSKAHGNSVRCLAK